MKQGDDLGEAERIVKYVPPRLRNEDGSIDGYVFLPRERDKDGSSVHILHFYSNDAEESLTRIRANFRLNLAASGAFAETIVADLKAAAERLRQPGKLSVIYDPLDAEHPFDRDDAHALITGLPFQGVMDELVALTFDGVVLNTYPSRS